MPKCPKAMIFDWDNTLVDAWGCVTEALNTAREAFGQQSLDIEATRCLSARSARDIFKDWYGDQAETAHKIFYDRYQSAHLNHLKPLPGADGLLSWANAHAVPAFVVSNKRGDILRRECDFLRWNDYFLAVVGSTDAARDKPARDPVDLAFDRANLLLDGPDVWFIGDTQGDVDCAANAGVRPVLVNNPDLGKQLDIDLTFSSCNDLLEYLNSLEQP